MAKLRAAAVISAMFFLSCLHIEISEGFSASDVTLEDLLRGLRDMAPGLSRHRRLTGTSVVSDPCTYPGLMAITAAGRMLGSGIFYNGALRVPDDVIGFLERVNAIRDLTMLGENGAASATISKDKMTTFSNNDGTTSIKLSTSYTPKQCTVYNAVIYDKNTMDIDVSTCTVASYGGKTIKLFNFDNTLKTSPLKTTPLASCCQDVMPNLVGQTTNVGFPNVGFGSRYSCIKSTEGVCYGDNGAPIYCKDKRSGQEVVVGMVNSGMCTKEEVVIAIDFTGGTLKGFSS